MATDSLKDQIRLAAHKYVSGIVAAVLAAPIGELADLYGAALPLAGSRRPSARSTPRASARASSSRASGNETVDAIVTVLRDQPGLAIRQLQGALSLTRARARSALATGVKMGRLRMTGVRRSARYYVR